MKRRRLTTPAGLSLLLCAAVCLLWVRSYWRWDAVSVGHKQPAGQGPADGCSLGVASWGNGLIVECTLFQGVRNVFAGLRDWGVLGLYHTYWGIPAQRGQRSGFEFQHVHYSQAGTGWSDAFYLRMPHWAAAALAATPAGLWLLTSLVRRRRAARATAQHVCAGCGYDLRATPERCPECGAPADGR
jgi:hypothetical protein